MSEPLITNYKKLSVDMKLCGWDNLEEWELYKKEHPEEFTDVKRSPEDRFKGDNAIEAFSKSIEYCRRSMGNRIWHYYLARELCGVLHEEEKHTILDFGCGAGNIGIMLATMGFDVTFLDVEGSITRFIKWRIKKRFLDCKVLTHNDTFTGLGHYDFILMLNVLEHLEKPLETLQIFVKNAKEGDLFLCTFQSQDNGLDIVPSRMWGKTLLPYIESQYSHTQDSPATLFRKK